MHPVSIQKPEGKTSWRFYCWFEDNIKKGMEYNGAGGVDACGSYQDPGTVFCEHSNEPRVADCDQLSNCYLLTK